MQDGPLHNLSVETVQAARSLWAEGNYAAAWDTLAAAGDTYADNAAAVVGTPTSADGEAFHVLVEKHWENATGSTDAYAQKFSSVARDHLNNYLTTLAACRTSPAISR